jgi:mono/diheme cytochrome c family protein
MINPTTKYFLFSSVALLLVFQSCFESHPGEATYFTHCVSCHGVNGQGVEGQYPSLVRSPITKSNIRRSILLIKYGSREQEMEPIELTDQEMADVMNFVNNSWGNTADDITADYVKRLSSEGE